MPGSGAVTRNTLRRQIADALRDEVLAGRLPPGTEFTVKQIAEQYEVSATPVREALVDLSAQGLLESVQHRGFRVRTYSVDDFRGMIEARMLIVDGIFRRLVERGAGPGAGEMLVSVRRRGEEARRAAQSGSLEVLIGYDLRFWRELSGLVGNTYISEFLHRIRVQCWVFSVPHLQGTADMRSALWDGHRELVEAVTRADATEVRRIVHAYNQHGLDWAAGL
ncbi:MULTISPECIES: GntR family transcriptional regulator [unclassified Streptomyces]|uniref:GntR family transcriptional regulator n=1 Tax=unclassified Streptomyces TaxID=2593676 RepID=UPI00226E642C|nr:MULTISPECIES: GntR family transcriptional regulator [unclassified Streptomyces]MCY0923859.1 GntR family transcriptional regulator [Streptomyces sp. H27-G5]MCY0961951.1 GntR family transcriptional regulator [Streptomyces sp. H27-H5]